MFKLKSNNIEDFPFEEYAKCNDSQLEDLAKSHHLSGYNSWMLPQIGAYYGGWKVTRNAAGKIDPQLTAKENIATPWEIGLWRVCTKLKRSSLVRSQINPEFASYSALVPIILMGLKKYKGIKYSEWDLNEETLLVDKNLREALFWEPQELEIGVARYGLGSERLLELREQGLTIKSGAKAGTKYKPTSSWCLRGMRGTELERAPKLVGTMLAQIWVAHPSLRTDYMILDPVDWDWMPPPLIESDIFLDNPELPWETEPRPQKNTTPERDFNLKNQLAAELENKKRLMEELAATRAAIEELKSQQKTNTAKTYTNDLPWEV